MVGILGEGVDEGVKVVYSVGRAYAKCKFPGVVGGEIETGLTRVGSGGDLDVVGA